jgi:hypothetical protein
LLQEAAKLRAPIDDSPVGHVAMGGGGIWSCAARTAFWSVLPFSK